MSTAAVAGGATTQTTDGVLRHSFRSMATTVTLAVVEPTAEAAAAVGRGAEVVRRVAATCTRFDPTSALMRANATPRRWCEVPAELFLALREAATAYRVTDGLFDPRVLETLESWGYDRTLPFAGGDVTAPAGRRPVAAPARRRWRPRFDAAGSAVRLGRDPVDLGGIAKGLAVRLASAELVGAGRATLVEAGGDLHVRGAGPDGAGWSVAVEDPRGGEQPVAVLRLCDAACATSSVRLRRWRLGDRSVHHLVDPRTGEPASSGLLSVTVVGPDPATAEVWSKALFVAGRGRVRRIADDLGLAALLVDDDGVVGISRAMRPLVAWRAVA